jgi:type IV pilus assembly protein PilA
VIIRTRSAKQRGFSISELLVVVGMLGALSGLGVPSLLGYWRTSSLAASASEVAGVLYRARQLAVMQGTNVCVKVASNALWYMTGTTTTCGGGTMWTSVGMKSDGTVPLSSGFNVTTGVPVVFTSLGGTTAAATYTVTDPSTNRSRNVVVVTSGRVAVQ